LTQSELTEILKAYGFTHKTLAHCSPELLKRIKEKLNERIDN